MVVISTRKQVDEVLNTLKENNVRTLVVISCGSCAALCQTGGTEGLKEYIDILEKEGFEILTSAVIEDVCDNRVMMKDLRKINPSVEEADAILSLACGSGAQSIVQVLNKKHPNKKVFTANDTQFIGMVERIGRFRMKCLGCGDCLLNETGGICPITTCAKALMNGPCGGMVEGKCEVGNYERECGWVLVYNRLKAIGRLDLFSKLREARDWKDSGHQREVVWR
jgi:ferredoxin